MKIDGNTTNKRNGFQFFLLLDDLKYKIRYVFELTSDPLGVTVFGIL